MSLDFDALAMMAAVVDAHPSMFDMVKEHERFEEIEHMLVAEIANADSTSTAMSVYTRYGSLLPEWKFIFASHKGPVPGFAVHRTFSDGSVIRGLFSSASVIILDQDIHRAMLANATVTFPFDYSIALDTQALSYLAPYIEGKTTALAKDFHEIFCFIARGEVYVDPVPYLTENLSNISLEKNVPQIRRRLAAYEILRTIDERHLQDTGRIQSVLSDDERERNVERYVTDMVVDAANPELMAAVNFRHDLCYCVLLKMATIQLRNNQKSHAAKVEEFIEFMDTQLHTLWLREIVIAAEYFKRGQKLTFFGKLQKGPATKLTEQFAVLKGMAWDFWHIRYLESAATLGSAISDAIEIKPRYFFPALLTCDKRFIEIIDLYPLRSCAYKQDSRFPLPFPVKDWINIAAGSADARTRLEEKYLSLEASRRRAMNRERLKTKLPAMIIELETEFSKAATA